LSVLFIFADSGFKNILCQQTDLSATADRFFQLHLDEAKTSQRTLLNKDQKVKKSFSVAERKQKKRKIFQYN